MDFKQLRYFVGICDAGSMTRASKLLRIAQPALSNHIASMEAQLGVGLLHRSPSGVVPTESGEILYAGAQRIMRDFSRLSEEVKFLDRNPSGPVVIGVAEAPSEIFGHVLLQHMLKRYPEVSLYYTSNLSIELHQKLVKGILDVGVYYKETDVQGVESRTLLKELLFVAAAAKSRKPGAGADRPITLSELRKLPFVFPRRTHFSMRHIVERTFEGLDFTPQVLAEVDSFNVLKKYVAAGDACTILPWSAVHEEVKNGSILLRPVENLTLSRNIDLCLPLDRPHHHAVKATCRVIREVVSDLITSGEWKFATLVEDS